MSKSYRVFTSAPLTSPGSYAASSWITASSRALTPPLPPATLEKAVHQISLLYQNVIFNDDGEEQDNNSQWKSVEEIRDELVMDLSPPHPVGAISQPNTMSPNDSSFYDTFNTDLTGDETTMLSEGSSISRFPVFNFSISMLSSLFSLLQAGTSGASSSKVMLLLGVLEVDGPNFVTPKIGAHAGSEVCVLRLIIGDEHGAICKLVAWRETAERWGGIKGEPGLTRGDIVLFENVLFSQSSFQPQQGLNPSKAQITASPNLDSNAQICYRTLPRTYEDSKRRPDLRLAESVPAVRKVAESVKWMERMAGIAARRAENQSRII